MSISTTFPNFAVNDLPDVNLIGGTTYVFTFQFWDTSGNPINISTYSSLDWYMSNFGSASALLHLSGSYITSGSWHNQMSVTLSGSNTLSLSTDKYQHQPALTDFNGVSYRPSNGNINLVRAIQ